MLSLAELHGLIVHLPLLAVPVFALLAILRWRGRGGELVRLAEPWAFGAAVLGTLVAVVTGLAVLGQARTELRGSAQRLVFVHLGVGLALLLVLAVLAWRRRKRSVRAGSLAAVGIAALALATVGGYLGGRMVFAHGVGVRAGGQFAVTARGAELLAAGLATSRDQVALGRAAFRSGLRCGACHGMQAEGRIGPPLAGGIQVDAFRSTHGEGLFPRSVVTDRMVAAIDAWLRTLPPIRGGD